MKRRHPGLHAHCLMACFFVALLLSSLTMAFCRRGGALPRRIGGKQGISQPTHCALDSLRTKCGGCRCNVAAEFRPPDKAGGRCSVPYFHARLFIARIVEPDLSHGRIVPAGIVSVLHWQRRLEGSHKGLMTVWSSSLGRTASCVPARSLGRASDTQSRCRSIRRAGISGSAQT